MSTSHGSPSKRSPRRFDIVAQRLIRFGLCTFVVLPGAVYMHGSRPVPRVEVLDVMTPVVIDRGDLGEVKETFCGSGDRKAIAFKTAPSGPGSTFTFEWFFKDGDQRTPTVDLDPTWTKVNGATAATFDPPNVTASRTFVARVIPSNGPAGFARGRSVVIIKPVVLTLGTLTPGDQNLTAPADPANITFATPPTPGVTTFTFQWFFRDGVNPPPPRLSTAGWTAITGATSTTYNPPAGLRFPRTFACFVSPRDSSCGPSPSFAAGVRQITMPSTGAINVPEQGGCTPMNGTPISFSAPPFGAPSFTFQWFSRDGAIDPPVGNNTAGWTRINAATANTFDPPAGVTVTRSYACLVTPSVAAPGLSTGFASGKGVVKVFAANDIQYGQMPFSFPSSAPSPVDPPLLSLSNQPSGSSGTFTFQWFFKNGQNDVPITPSTVGWTAIPGATKNTFDPGSGLSVTRTFACFTTPTFLCPGFAGDWVRNPRVFIVQ